MADTNRLRLTVQVEDYAPSRRSDALDTLGDVRRTTAVLAVAAVAAAAVPRGHNEAVPNSAESCRELPFRTGPTELVPAAASPGDLPRRAGEDGGDGRSSSAARPAP